MNIYKAICDAYEYVERIWIPDGIDDSEDEKSNALDLLDDISRYAEEYQWHDLATDIDDRPINDEPVLVMFRKRYRDAVWYMVCSFSEWEYLQKFENSSVIKWRYIDGDAEDE